MNWQSISYDWNQVRALHATVEAGSLSAAARALGLSQPTLSRQIAALEADLGITLFERVGRSLTLTDAGRHLLSHVRQMGEAASRISLAAASQAQALDGLVRITSSDLFAAHILPGMLQRLYEVAPGIEVEVVASNAISDLLRRDADIAIRNARPDHPDLIARRLPDTAGNLYAATRFLDRHGRPTSLRDLADVPLVGFTGRSDAMLAELQARGIPLSEENIRWSADSGIVAWEMVRSGLGYGVMLADIAARTPEVECCLPDLPPIPVPLWIVTHRELQTSRRIRLVFDLLSELLAP